MSELPSYRCSGVAAGQSGAWSITRTRQAARATPVVDLRAPCFHYRPGEYAELRHDGITFMTDLYDEWYTQRSAIARARAVGGSVLITGLGLGLVVESILAEPAPAVDRIVVLEQSADVIALVAPYLTGRCGARVEIVHTDAFHWRAPRGAHFATVWHDIWPDPHAAHVAADIARLEHHHAAWSTWQGYWPIEYQRALAGAA
jgi:hypothetical protein